MPNHRLRGICLAGVITLSSACSGLPLQPKTPDISRVGVQVAKLALNEQRFHVRAPFAPASGLSAIVAAIILL